MPDHLVEALQWPDGGLPSGRRSLIALEPVDPELAVALKVERRRFEAAHGRQPRFTFRSEAPLGAGTLLKYQWADADGAVPSTHLLWLTAFHQRAVLVFVDLMPGDDEAAALASLQSLACAPKGP